jgi:hypothetical protein
MHTFFPHNYELLIPHDHNTVNSSVLNREIEFGTQLCGGGSWINMGEVSAWNKCYHCCKNRWP